MSDKQETLPGAPAPRLGEGGLWARYIRNGEIDHAAWLRACAENQLVGTCRRCGGYLIPQRPAQRGERFDYAAECENCAAEVNAPGGRVARGSTRRSERR